jgi:hypothetical protein
LAWYSSDTSWHYRDVTNDGAGTPPDLNSPLAVTAANLLPQVYYQRDQEVHQLAWSPPDYWHDAGLLTVSNWPSAIADSPLSATTAGNNSLTASLVSNVSHGELTLYDDGSFVYKPQSGFTGSDGFTYVASAGSAQSAETTVELIVSDECAPVDGNLIRNFCFAAGKTEWKFYHTADSNGSYTVSSSSPFAGESAAEVTVSVPGRIQLYQAGLALLPNTTYELAFAANSSNGADMRVYVHQQRAPFNNFSITLNAGNPVDLKPYWKHFALTFTTPNVPAQELANMRLRFWFRGAKAGTVFQIDRVFLRASDRPEGASELVAASSFNDEYMSELLAGAEIPDDSVTEVQMSTYLPVVSGQ